MLKINLKKCMAAASTAAVCAMVVYGTTRNVISDDKYYEAVEEVKNNAAAAASDTDSYAAVSGVSKEETVYILSDANGTAKKIIVSDWLKNSESNAVIDDYSELKNIENVKGYETFSQSDSSYVWAAAGNDIYYRGESEKAAPVEMKVTYILDGKEMTPGEIAGKSGKVTIRAEFVNNQKETVEADGQKMEVNVPFVVAGGTILDNDVFRNIEVKNAKLINDGDRSLVAAAVLPGVADTLSIDAGDFEIPEYFEITADVTNFEFTGIYAMAASDIFTKINIDNIENVDDLNVSLLKMKDAMTQLMDGSGALYEGLSTLNDKSGTLIEGVEALYSGAGKINDGAGTLAAGALELYNGTESLKSGVTALGAGADTLKTGIDELYAGTSTLKSGASDLAAGADTLKTGADNLKDGAEKLSAGLSTLDSNSAKLNGGAEQIFNLMLSQADAALAEAGLTVNKLTIDNYAQVLNAVSAQITAAAGEGAAADIIALKAQLDSYNEFYTGLITYTESVSQTAEGAEKLSAGVEKLSTGAESLSTGAKSLSAGAERLNTGAGKLSAGAESLTSGIATLSTGANSLNTGAKSLSIGAETLSEATKDLTEGAGTLSTGSAALADGVAQLAEGSEKLNNGITQFNEEAVEKLISVFDGDINGLISKVNAMSKAAGAYNNYSGIIDGADGSVKFIYRTDAIEINK